MNKGIENYVEIKLGYKRELIERGYSYRLNMLWRNNIEGLICPIVMEENGVVKLKYGTGHMCTLKAAFDRIKPDGGTLRTLVSGMNTIIRNVEKYMLDENDLILNPEYIFVDLERKSIQVLCAPGYNVNIKQQIRQLVEYIMKILDYKDQDGVAYLYQLYDEISGENADVKQALITHENNQMVYTMENWTNSHVAEEIIPKRRKFPRLFMS